MHQEVNGHTSHDTAELLAVSNQLMDQEFLDMDRVITLDDMDFALALICGIMLRSWNNEVFTKNRNCA
jgi:hypothetical protein